MEMQARFHIPWYAGDQRDDSWIGYLYRNLHHIEGENIPFKDTSWSFSQDEAWLHDDVLEALYRSKDVDASGITVIVIKNVVTLSGYVLTAKQKDKAEEIISSFHDVWSVRNDLIVKIQ